jgi:hypothetical protein
MASEEQRISFMNRYFVFRKVRSVNAEKVGKMLMNKGFIEEEEPEEKPLEKPLDKEAKPLDRIVKIKKTTKTKVVLKEVELEKDEPDEKEEPKIKEEPKTIKIRVKKQ